MKTIFDPAARASLARRMERVAPDGRPRWGRMSAPQMLCHVSDALRMAVGDLPVKSKGKMMLANPVVRWLAIYVLPWPKGKTRTAPEMLTAQPTEWAADLATFRALLERAGAKPADGPWPVHPLFGDINGKTWGALSYRHLDHHLTQFGA